MELARKVDENCFLQLGSSVILKYTDAGLKMWELQEDWTPTIIDICRQWSFLYYLRGHPAKWIVRGLNLQGATLKAATEKTSEELIPLVEKHEKGIDIIICEEPDIIQQLAPRFQERVSIFASKDTDLVEGVSVKLRSEAKHVQTAYWLSNLYAVIPGPWIMIISAALSLLSYLNRSTVGRKFVFSRLLANLGIIAGMYLRQISPSTAASIIKFWNDSLESSATTEAMALTPSTFKGDHLPGCEGIWERISYTRFGTDDIWSHLRIGLEVYIRVYLVYLFVIVFIFSWKLPKPTLALLFRVMDMCNGSKFKTPKPPEGIKQISASVWELYCPSEGIIPELDIVFFHGLQMGDFEDAFWKTWVSTSDENLVWPQKWLSQKFPKARILSVSYNSSATKDVKQEDMHNLGENLVGDIILDDDCKLGRTGRPVFLVGHSLGGIVIKQFILSAIADRNVEKIRLFVRNFKGVFYYATPHGGSEIADLASHIKEVNPILSLLKTLDTERGRINEAFRINRWKLDAKAFAVAEQQPIKILGFHKVVVGEASARHDIDRFYTFTEANHFTVCKARSPNDAVVIQKLTHFITDTVPQLKIHSEDEQHVVENTGQEVLLQSNAKDTDDITRH